MFEHNLLPRAVLLALVLVTAGCGSDPSSTRRAGGGAGGDADGPGSGGSSGEGGAGATAGSAGVGAGAAGPTGGAASSAGAGEDLGVHIEDGEQLVVEVVTVSCPGECVEVKAVASGGRPAYHFSWEDGSTSATRMLCPAQDAMHEVTVTDTPTESEEFGRAMQTARASVDSRVLDCAPPLDGGVGPDSGAQCEDDSDCGAGQTCFEGICVGEGGLRFSLTWNEDTDFDLFVRMPDGTEISFIFPMRGGGMLDVDDCFESCRIPGGPHVENIFFEGEPPRGTYTYWVVNSGLVTADDFRLEVSAGGAVQATQMDTIAAFTGGSDRYTFEF